MPRVPPRPATWGWRSTPPARGTVTGSQILGGLNTVLLSNLNGGQGLGTLGYMKLTDGNGNSVNVNLSSAVTLQDVIDDINSQIQTNNAATAPDRGHHGRGQRGRRRDPTGRYVGGAPQPLATRRQRQRRPRHGRETRLRHGLRPGHQQHGHAQQRRHAPPTVSQNTLLSSYNGGAGVAAGSFQITDTDGNTSTINVTSSMQTIGDVINAINRNTTGVHAAINSTGDGIVLTDTADGTGTLSVTEGDSTTAADLNLLGAETTVDGTQTINGSTTHTITLKSADTLTDLQNDINNLGAGLSAGIITDGSSNPYRLSLTATQSGQAGNMIVDASQIGGMSLAGNGAGPGRPAGAGRRQRLQLRRLQRPRRGHARPPTRSTSVLPGVSLQINSATRPARFRHRRQRRHEHRHESADLRDELQQLPFAAYHRHRLQHDDRDRRGAVRRRIGPGTRRRSCRNCSPRTFAASGPVQSLADVGITVQSDGTLSFNQNQFDSAWAANPTAVQQLFTTAKTGVSAQFDTLINQLAGPTDSLLSARTTALQNEISDNQSTITQMNSAAQRRAEPFVHRVLQHGPHDREAEEHPERAQYDHPVAPDFGANSSSEQRLAAGSMPA